MVISEENVEIVRRIYTEGLIDRDPKRLVDQFATSEIEYVNPPEAVDPGIRRGRAEVRLALRRARQSSASYRHELHELFDLGDTVVAAVRKRRTPGPSATARWFGSNGVAIWGPPSKPPGCGSRRRRIVRLTYELLTNAGSPPGEQPALSHTPGAAGPQVPLAA
jgi:ketosteroid isomerase-like protein